MVEGSQYLLMHRKFRGDQGHRGGGQSTFAGRACWGSDLLDHVAEGALAAEVDGLAAEGPGLRSERGG